jgi:hypothetical protein
MHGIEMLLPEFVEVEGEVRVGDVLMHMDDPSSEWDGWKVEAL